MQNKNVAPSEEGKDNSKPSILIIDDNPDFIIYLEVLLAEDYHVIIAENGEEGIQLATEKLPDLIISDLAMPKKTGFEVCEYLKGQDSTKEIPFILFTGWAADEVHEKVQESKVDATLTKPFQVSDLHDCIQQWLS